MPIRKTVAVVAVLGAFAVLVGLGLWQLDRRAWKQERIAAAAAGLEAAPLALAEAAPDPGAVWRRAALTATTIPAGRVEIGPKTVQGKVGMDHALPARLANGDIVIVVLGFVANDAPASTRPTPPDGHFAAAGVLTRPERPSRMMPDNRPPDSWLWLEPRAIAAAAGLDPDRTSPLALRLEPPWPGFQGEAVRPNLPDNHLQYALTWFGLAGALAGVAAIGVWRRRRPGQRQP